MGENFSGLVSRYITQGNIYIENLESALIKQDAEAIFQNAHSLKPMSEQFGAKKLSELARILEKAGNDNDIHTAHSTFPQLKEEFDAIKQFLQPYA